MEFNIKELRLLLKGIEQLGGNDENWNMQDKLITEINEKELDKYDDILCHMND